jgi:predicted metal-dependent phosphoesterase TrpH
LDSKNGGGIDLHIHSTASDGTHAPQEIVAMAAKLGLQAIAITDHDTLDGSRQAFTCDKPTSLSLLSGIEISVQAPAYCNIKGSLHILGYGIDPEDPPLLQALKKFQTIRKERILRIVDRMNQLGTPLTVQLVKDEAGNGTPGRPHVASAMVKAGYAKDINDAFDRYLGNGKPACIEKARMKCEKAFDLIHSAGGIPVLAHPYLIPCRTQDDLERLVKNLCDLGLKGLEIYYPQHTPEGIAHYLQLADKYGLLVTGGTDFHGELIPEIALGRGSGDFFVPYELYERMISRYALKHFK